MAKFSITNPLKTYGESSDIRYRIMKKIPQKILYTKSKEELCFYVLSHFNFIELKSDTISIENNCKIILSLMGIEDDFEESLDITVKPELKDPLNRFMHYFLELDDLPGNQLDRLKMIVNNDLKKVNELIKEYEKIDFIQKGETPRNHDQRTKNDFYKRCINERDKIKHHLKKGVKERAFLKAGAHRLLGSIEIWFEGFYDRPYKIPMPKSNEYFNHESIDKVGHRVGEIAIREGRELKKLYKTNKQQFYEELEKYIAIDKVLQLMLSQIKFLPFITQQRKLIFAELVDLFSTKKYFGFYSLALTQIEGLFTEMCKMCQPGYANNKASLSDKVEFVRPFHPYSESKFDYFQYHLPNLRNRFLHYGTDTNEKIEILCNDILYDLEEVVSIFSSLNIDAIWFLRLIRKRDEIEFMSIKGLCFYFKMLISVKRQKQYHFFEDEVKSLNEIFLPEIVYNVVFDLDKKIEVLIEKVEPIIKIQSAMNGFEVELNKTPIKTINEHPTEIKKCLGETINWQLKEDIQEMLQIAQFFKLYKQNLNTHFIEDDVKNKIEYLAKKYALILNKVKVIAMHSDFKMD